MPAEMREETGIQRISSGRPTSAPIRAILTGLAVSRSVPLEDVLPERGPFVEQSDKNR